MRELRAGNNFESQDPAEAHFGLGSGDGGGAESAWCGRMAATATLAGVAADHLLTVHRDGTIESTPRGALAPTPTPTARPTASPTTPPACLGDCGADAR